MLKATLRSAVLLAIVAIGMLAVSMPGFAEVQNIKVGGDETVRGFWRSNMDLRGEEDPGTVANALDGHDDFFMNTLGINVNANLTENVEVEARIVNERDLGTSNTNTAQGDIDISRANVKIKDIFYSPFTLTLGTFPVSWGRGLVLGSNLIPSIVGGNDRNASITANEFTDFTSFDGLRLKGEFGGTAAISMPLSLDLVYLKIAEGLSGVSDDTNLLGFNVGTRFDNGEAEIYYLNKHNKSPTYPGTADASDNHGSVNTLGIRGSARPVENSNVYGELAYQFGKRDTDASSFGLIPGDAQQAWAFDLGAEVTFADVAAKPMVGAEWLFFSGHDYNSCGTAAAAAHCGGGPGWDPIAKGYFTTIIRDFQTSSGVGGFYAPDQAGVTGSQTNQHQLSLYGSFKPLEDLTVAPRLSWFVMDKAVRSIPLAAGANTTPQEKKSGYIGMEWDTQVTYNYTDDVQFGLLYGLFTPGNVFLGASGLDSTAQELISSVSVKF